MIYAYSALKMGIPFANGAPNLTVDIPAMVELSKLTETPIAGKDFKTGQTLMKTILAPGLAARSLGVRGWFSTNILGNRDGLVLDDPDNFKTKEVSKPGCAGRYFQTRKITLNYTATCTIKYVSIITRHMAIIKKAGITLTFLAGEIGYKMQIKI